MFVYIDGRQVWLGPEDDPVTHERYDGLVAMWLAGAVQPRRAVGIAARDEPETA
jgi:hypothetical protein